MDVGAAMLRASGRVASPLGALADLALPAACGGCGRAGATWCPDCARDVARSTATVRIVAGPAGGACGPGGVVLAAGVYEGPLRSAVVAFKDDGRRDLLSVLAPIMRAALVAAVRLPGVEGGRIAVVPAPSSRRSRRARGDVPLHLLVRQAVCGVERMTGRGVVWAPVLGAVRGVADQARLSRDARRTNVDGAFTVRPGRVLSGLDVVVADDVVTSGATATECVRAVRAAGGRPVAVVALAATPRPGR